jgi:SsrA-binding protein
MASKKTKTKPKPTAPKPGKSSKKKKDTGPSIKVISENRRARHKYQILESIECGLVLTGSEVKSLREGSISLNEAYVRSQKGALWLIGADIAHFKQASIFNHETKRERKLLLHKKEFEKYSDKALTKGLTLVPLKCYFNHRGVVKLVIGVGRGKKVHDKREALKASDSKRQIDRQMKANLR